VYLRLTRGRFDPARFDQLQRFAEQVVAAVQRLPGFQHFYGGVDRAAGTFVVVTLHDSEAHARFPREFVGDVIARMQVVGVELEPPVVYEVAIHA
jgi:hypothetical protein